MKINKEDKLEVYVNKYNFSFKVESSTLRLSVTLQQDTDINKIINPLNIILNNSPFLMECSISISFNSLLNYELLDSLVKKIEKIRFGVGRKVPILYFFFPIEQEINPLIQILNNHNHIDKFINLVQILDGRYNLDKLSRRVLENVDKANQFFINYILLFNSIDNKTVEQYKLIKTLTFMNNLSYWFNTKKTDLNEEEIDFFSYLDKVEGLDYLPLLPPGILDYMWCSKFMHFENNSDYYLNLQQLVNNFRYYYLQFNGNDFSRLSFESDNYLLERILTTLNTQEKHMTLNPRSVSVRTAMSDYVALDDII